MEEPGHNVKGPAGSITGMAGGSVTEIFKTAGLAVTHPDDE
jgi:hypothetical protein